jgi:hypothetical protein
MKTSTKILGLAIFSMVIFFSACKKKVEDAIYVSLPTENITTYTGKLGFSNNDGSLPIANQTDGKATISQSDKVITIAFSDNVPTVSGIKFIKSGSDYVSVSENGSAAGISFSGNTVKVAVTKDGKTWGFDGTK